MADPFEPYLKQADSLFAAGDIVKAGQIWQAILKREPGHEEARAGLYRVKAHFDARATQDGLPASEPDLPPQASDRHTLTPAPPELNTLLEAGCALYDAGLLPKAIATWEMALHQDPGNALARGYIDGARRKLEAEAAPVAPILAFTPLAKAPEPEAEDVQDKLLRDGCTLFDMGQIEDALGKWERILAVDPGHALALAYVADARRELGLPPRGGGPAPEPAPVAVPAALQAQPGPDTEVDSRAAQMVREGVQIYDMGMYAEAEQKWQEALALDPACRDAQGYLEMAARDRDQAPPGGTPRPEPARPAPPPPPDPLEAQLAAAENLLRNQRFEEAAFSFQRLLEAGAQDPRVLQGYQHARAFLTAQEPAPPPAAPAPPMPVAVSPPRAVSAPRAPARGGLRPPRFLERLRLPAWLGTPRNRIAAGAGILVLVLGVGLLRAHQRDLALREAVATAKANALAPVARNLQVAVLAETPKDIRAEAERSLADDPLTGYYRAQECLRLDPADAAAAQLLERARARMAATAPVGSAADLDKSMKAGDLESSRNALGDQLRANPDDPELKAKARIIYLALAQSLASAEKYAEARELLLQGRAMYPQDKTWQARLKLLEGIQGMAKADRARWIPLLG